MYYEACIYERDRLFDVCICKVQATMGTQVPCALRVCDCITHIHIYIHRCDAHLAHGRPEKTLSTGTRSHACMHTC